jgi:hypothetical protein
MPRRPAAVTQADIARAIRALRDAGAPMERVRVRMEAGSIIVEMAGGHPRSANDAPQEPDGERKVIVL